LVAGTVLLALALVPAGCGAATIPTGTPRACPDALVGPVTLLLAEDGTSTMAMLEEVVPFDLRWPDGYGLRPDPGGGEIVDERGNRVARIGDEVWLSGGFAPNDDTTFIVCGVS